jgi:hypothetical protein
MTGSCKIDVEQISTILRMHDVPTNFGLLSIDSEGNNPSLINEMLSPVIDRTISCSRLVGGRNPKRVSRLHPDFTKTYEIIARTAPNLILKCVR